MNIQDRINLMHATFIQKTNVVPNTLIMGSYDRLQLLSYCKATRAPGWVEPTRITEFMKMQVIPSSSSEMQIGFLCKSQDLEDG